MTMARLDRLRGDESGKAAIKLALGSCLLALFAAAASPGFETNPMIGDTVMQMRQHVPETLDRITRALRGG